MAKEKKAADDRQVHLIREALQKGYGPKHPKARVDVKRYNSVSIRVRVIDPDFAGMDLVDRDEAVWEALEAFLAEDARAEVSMLILLTPKESKRSLMNLEFEDPTPSVLQ